MNKIFLYICLFLVAGGVCQAAYLHGSIYDNSLQKRGNVVLEINTAPKQTFVSKTGNYRFDVIAGNYTITAHYYGYQTLATKKSIAISDEKGDYTLDLILFPVDEQGNYQIYIKPSLTREYMSFFIMMYLYWIIGTAVVLVFAVAAVVIMFRRKNKKKKEKPKKQSKTKPKKAKKSEAHVSEIETKPVEEEKKKTPKLSEELQQVYGIILEAGGRVTQKEIRKQIPLSEAKISLMVSELESKGYVEKIKKGRGNIIIIKQ